MGFKYLALQTEPEALFNHAAGALLTFVGAWMCWEAMVISRDAWWRDPINCAKFAQRFRTSGSWVTFVENHPATISEMIGDQKRAQGAVAMAMCIPACMLTLAGGFMVNQAWPVAPEEDPLFAHLTNAMRSALMPVGFLMVLFTPIISLDKYEYGKTGTGTPWKSVRPRSEVEERWHMQHHNVHAAGFILAVVLGILWEAGFLVCDLFWYANRPVGGLPWPALARFCWCTLAFLRGACLVLQVTSVVTFVLLMSDRIKLKDTRLFNFKKWNCEYACLVLGGMVIMYDAASVFVFAGHGPRSLADWPSLLIVAAVLLEGLRCAKGFLGIGSVRWNGLAALYDFNKVDFEGLIRYVLVIRCCPALLFALKSKSKAELLGIDVAQAGDKDEFTVPWHDLGAGLPQLQALIMCPGLVENVGAITFDELSDADLLIYHEDLGRVLRQLPSAEVMLVPFGRTVYKIGRRMPLAVLILGDYEGDLQAVRRGVPGATPRLPESCERIADCGATLGFGRQGLRINKIPYWPSPPRVGGGALAQEALGKPWLRGVAAVRGCRVALVVRGSEDVARDITDPVRARLPAGSWRQDLVVQLEVGVDLRPLYQVLKRELEVLEEYEIQFRGIVGAPPQIVAVTLRENLHKAQQSVLWNEGTEVMIMENPAGAEGKL